MAFTVFPAIDLIDGKCVRLKQGSFDQTTFYQHTPKEFANSLKSLGFTNLHLVDLDGAKKGSPVNWDSINQVVSSGLVVDFGGGARTAADIEKLLEAGVNKINIGSALVKAPDEVKNWIKTFGPENFIAAIDCLNEFVQAHGWQETSNLEVTSFIKLWADKGLTTVTCTDISKDGMMQGPSLNLYQKILAAVPEIKLIASGGIRNQADLQACKDSGLNGAIVGIAIHSGALALEDALIVQTS